MGLIAPVTRTTRRRQGAGANSGPEARDFELLFVRAAQGTSCVGSDRPGRLRDGSRGRHLRGASRRGRKGSAVIDHLVEYANAPTYTRDAAESQINEACKGIKNPSYRPVPGLKAALDAADEGPAWDAAPTE